MRHAAAVLIFASAAALRCQTPPASLAPASPAPASPAVETPPALSGSLDIGYRWVGVGGGFNTYRSIVDLGSGFKLLGADFTFLNPKTSFFDRLDVRAYNWGDDPWSTLHVGLRKAKLYDFQGDYRNIAYYSNLPAFADPLHGAGVTLNEQALDTRKKIGDWRLELLPGGRIVPYLEYEHTADNGTGVSTFVANADEYPVASLTRDSGENYRGGVRLELPRLHMKLEQGGVAFKDDEQLNQGAGSLNYGNSSTPVLGRTLDLTALTEAYGVRGHGIYTDLSFSANPVSWADLYGSYLYSEPVSNVNFRALDAGSQILFSQALFYAGESNLISSLAKQPHLSATVGAEIRPFARLRVIPSWRTDRMHTAGSSTERQTLSATSGLAVLDSPTGSRLVSSSTEAEGNVFFDLSRKVILRGGYRYVWGSASDVILPAAGLTGFEQGKVRRNVALAGMSWHPAQSAWVNVDFEDGSSGSTYFRTGLYDYRKARVRGRAQVRPSLGISVGAVFLDNRNPSPGIRYDFLSHRESASLVYSPVGGKTWDFEGGYARSTLRSDIAYLDPAYLTPQRSFYRDNSHSVSALFGLNLPPWLGSRSRLSAGGSAFLSSGSNPTTFYQPTVRLTVGIRKSVAWVSEWRNYGFGEAFYVYQSFRAEMFTTGVRIAR